MQDFNEQKSKAKLSIKDKQKLVDAFVWLFKEDKKQNPAFYQTNNEEKDA